MIPCYVCGGVPEHRTSASPKMIVLSCECALFELAIRMGEREGSRAPALSWWWQFRASHAVPLGWESPSLFPAGAARTGARVMRTTKEDGSDTLAVWANNGQKACWVHSLELPGGSIAEMIRLHEVRQVMES